ncbi:prenyltransferase/squalene oxidase repeat-containing protein [Bacillus paramycoides]|uniref:prenyltransferase/squalene oxidase repeat-containing protein n=1 Tax=Bacillus paramycoides TaxID=2026194 RepID=UPI002E200763|nr:prenyltransferase/squalene oxidase repeat-containing protein [Bacillus paramycoides]MED0961840.1 prenyltransferase/squalene oxidase repeat-containing protein [Bacillus paramycoides]
MIKTLTLDSVKQFLLNNFWDKENKGFYAVLEGENIQVCDDKLLLDQCLSVLSLCYSKTDRSTLQDISQVFNVFYDAATNSFHEMTDRYGVIHTAGFVRHTYSQLLASFTLLELGSYLKEEELIEQGISLLQLVHEKSLLKGAPTTFDANWETVLIPNKHILNFVFAIFAAEKALKVTDNLKYKDHIKLYIKQLDEFIDTEHGGAFEILLNNGVPFTAEGKRTSSNVLASMAFLKTFSVLQDNIFLQKAENLFDFITDHMKHPSLGGYWNRCDIEGKVKVEPIQSYITNSDSPFPVKLIVDQSLLLLCASELYLYSNKDIYLPFINQMYEDVQKYIDEKNGGVFLGQGNWFSTPTDPTVPLIRHFMVPHHTPGAFYAGNTGYVPLHEKSTKTQAVTLIALMNATKNVPDIEYSSEYHYPSNALSKAELNFDLEKVTYNKDMQLQIDIEKYISWLKKTKSGPGFGLTAYRSPLGFRSDKSPQNFSALHVISDLTVMGMDIPVHEKELILQYMFSCQNEDGGFGEQPSHLSEVFTTYCVVATAYILGSDIPNKLDCISYLKQCQNRDGGFGNSPGYPSDIWHTNLAVLALHVLGETPEDTHACLSYAISCQHPDGGYGVRPGAPAETFSAFRAVDTILVLGKQPPNHIKTIEWLQNCQLESGGFVYKPGSPESFVGSYHAIAALYILGELPRKLKECKEWLAIHQAKDGGFSRAVNAPSDTTDEGFICLQASYMLESNLNPYWVAIIT